MISSLHFTRFFLSLIAFASVAAQQRTHVTPYPSSMMGYVRFVPYSTDYYFPAKQTAELDRLAGVWKSQNNDSARLKLYVMPCREELFKDPMIGYKRADKLLRFMVRKGAFSVGQIMVINRDVNEYQGPGKCAFPCVKMEPERL